MGPEALSDIAWHNWRARDLATLLFVVAADRILLIRKKRGLGAGKINGPGGRLQPDEAPLDGAVRETQEEVGITPLEVTFAGENRFQFRDGYSIHVWVYRAAAYRGTPVETAEAAPLWFPIERIPYDEMWEDDRHWMPLVLENRRFSGRYLFDGDRMLGHAIDVLC